MLTEREMENKLRDYAARFRQHVGNREWGKAHNLYNMALVTAVIAEMSEGFRKELFGEYDSEGTGDVADGLFGRDDVAKVDWECCVRRNMAYEDVECRRLGVPLGTFRRYSDSDYCAMCRKKKR